jgi:hypothetical protein
MDAEHANRRGFLLGVAIIKYVMKGVPLFFRVGEVDKLVYAKNL